MIEVISVHPVSPTSPIPTKELDLTFVKMVQQKTELAQRNKRAREYSAQCKRR